MKLLKSGLLTLFALWLVGTLAFFLSGFLTLVIGAPRWLPLPWSDFRGFIESPDGHVFVKINLHGRVLRYDRAGRFEASYPYPPGAGKDTELAASEENFIFFRSKSNVAVLSTSWDLLEMVQCDPRAERSWELGGAGHPVHSPHRAQERAPSRPVKAGELLFPGFLSAADAGPEQEVFHNADGSVLRRAGNSLERVSANGRVEARYGSLWIYKPFEFPIPAIFAWIAFVGIAAAFALRRNAKARASCRL